MPVQVAEECLKKAGDLSGLLLLYTAKGSAGGLADLVERAGVQGRQNVVFLCQLLLGDLSACVDLLLATGRIPEAAFFARTYLPSRMTEVHHCSAPNDSPLLLASCSCRCTVPRCSCMHALCVEAILGFCRVDCPVSEQRPLTVT